MWEIGGGLCCRTVVFLKSVCKLNIDSLTAVDFDLTRVSRSSKQRLSWDVIRKRKKKKQASGCSINVEQKMHLSFQSHPVWIITWPLKVCPATEELHSVSISSHASLWTCNKTGVIVALALGLLIPARILYLAAVTSTMVGLKPSDVPPPLGVKMASAGAAACIADIVTFPLDTAKVRLQVSAHKPPPTT